MIVFFFPESEESAACLIYHLTFSCHLFIFLQYNVIGGPDRDEFRVGQLYNSSRDSLHFVSASDPIETTNTTEVSLFLCSAPCSECHATIFNGRVEFE